LADGWNALNKQVELEAKRGVTVKTLMEKYAPNSENNTDSYTNSMVKYLEKNNPKVTIDTPLSKIPTKDIALGIAKHEDGNSYKEVLKLNYKENKSGYQVTTSTEKDLNNIPTNDYSYLDNVTDWGKRALVKTGIIDPYGTEKIKIQKEVPKKAAITKVNKDGSEVIENNFTLIGDVPSVTNSKEDKYFSYYNKFDRTKGFNYIPIKNVGASDGNTTYKNTKGIAHFILDSDVSTDYKKEEAIVFINKQLRGENIEPGSTVKDQFIPTYEKVENNQVNVKYKKISELTKEDKIMSPLRQYRYTDLNWKGRTKSLGFANSVKSIPTVTGDPTHIIFSPAKGDKDGYGKFGGVSVVFLANNKNIAIDFAGSVNQIKQQADKIIKEENIKPEDLIIAYHDLGSFSAKPKARKNNTLNFSQWSGFNTKPYTGGGLAFPSN
jgi:hypothetical protein